LTECAEEAGVYVLHIRWASAKAHLEGFRNSPEFKEFLAAVQSYVGDIEEMRHYDATGIVGEGGAAARTDPTLYEFLGGAPALSRLTEVFCAKVRADELLAPVFAGMDQNYPQHVALFLGEVFGGPPACSAERGGYPHMIFRHLGRALTEPMRRRWLWLLEDAADEVGLPDDPEFRAAFHGYLEWGTRTALMFSVPGAQRVVHTPMPIWGWGLTPQYRPEG
jgi:truncated hemoglobin YjbI